MAFFQSALPRYLWTFSAIFALTEANGYLPVLRSQMPPAWCVRAMDEHQTAGVCRLESPLLRVLEAREAVDIGQIHLPHGTVPLLPDDDLRHAAPPPPA